MSELILPNEEIGTIKTEGRDLMLKSKREKLKKEIFSDLEKIALKKLDIPTLNDRGRDRLDFHEVGIYSVLDALTDAFILGLNSKEKIG